MAARIFAMPQTNSVILAAASNDSSIKLFVSDNIAPGTFTGTAVLKGHEDWVRGLDFYADQSMFHTFCLNKQ